MKAVRRSTGLPIFSECVTDSWILDTEFVLRAERRGLRIVEIPVEVQEVRAPTYSSIARRVPRVLRNLTTLWSALRRLPHATPAEALASGRPSPTDDPDTAGEAALLRHDRRSV